MIRGKLTFDSKRGLCVSSMMLLWLTFFVLDTLFSSFTSSYHAACDDINNVSKVVLGQLSDVLAYTVGKISTPELSPESNESSGKKARSGKKSNSGKKTSKSGKKTSKSGKKSEEMERRIESVARHPQNGLYDVTRKWNAGTRK
jgi:hypothetical protein